MHTNLINAYLKWFEIYQAQPVFQIKDELDATLSDLWAATEVIARKACENELSNYMQHAIETEKAMDEFRDAIAKALEIARIADLRGPENGEKVDIHKNEGQTISGPPRDMSHMWG